MVPDYATHLIRAESAIVLDAQAVRSGGVGVRWWREWGSALALGCEVGWGGDALLAGVGFSASVRLGSGLGSGLGSQVGGW